MTQTASQNKSTLWESCVKLILTSHFSTGAKDDLYNRFISHIAYKHKQKKQLEEETRHEPRQPGPGLLRAGSSHINSQKSDR